MKLLKLTYFAVLTLLAGGLRADVCTDGLGKHPADVVKPNFLGQNGNANTILNGLSAYGTVPLALKGGISIGPTLLRADGSASFGGGLAAQAFQGDGSGLTGLNGAAIQPGTSTATPWTRRRLRSWRWLAGEAPSR